MLTMRKTEQALSLPTGRQRIRKTVKIQSAKTSQNSKRTCRPNRRSEERDYSSAFPGWMGERHTSAPEGAMQLEARDAAQRSAKMLLATLLAELHLRSLPEAPQPC